MEHGHPGSAVRSVSGGAEQKVLLDGYVADERQDEQRHAEHDEPQRADDPHHPASLRTPGPPRREHGEPPGAPHQRQSERRGRGGDDARASGEWKSPCNCEEEKRGDGAAAAAATHVRRTEGAEMEEAARGETSLSAHSKGGYRGHTVRAWSRSHGLNVGGDASAEEKDARRKDGV